MPLGTLFGFFFLLYCWFLTKEVGFLSSWVDMKNKCLGFAWSEIRLVSVSNGRIGLSGLIFYTSLELHFFVFVVT